MLQLGLDVGGNFNIHISNFFMQMFSVSTLCIQSIRISVKAVEQVELPIYVGCSGSSWNLFIKCSNIYIILSFF